MQNSRNDIDNNIVLRLRQNDEGALTELYNVHWRSMFISAYNLLKDKELCEDIVQEVFMGIWKNRASLNINVSFKSYLYACTRYQVFKQFRKNKDKIRLGLFDNLDQLFHSDSPETGLMQKEFARQVDAIVESLPEKCRKVYKLSRVEELSHKQISDTLNISTKTVENHITKALRILRIGISEIMIFFFMF